MTASADQTGKSAEAGIHRLTRLGINAYLVVEDDGLTAVDTGLSGMHELFLTRARELGMPIVRIAITHAHRDHRGSLDALATALPDVEVMVSEREAPLLAGNLALRAGEPAGPLRGGFKAAATRPTRLVADGDMIGSLRVVASPGHTPGHVAFFDTRDGTLFAGDAYVTTMGVATSAVVRWRYPMSGLATWNPALDLGSARRLRDLNPARLASGHGPVVAGPGPAMARAISAAAKKIDGA